MNGEIKYLHNLMSAKASSLNHVHSGSFLGGSRFRWLFYGGGWQILMDFFRKYRFKCAFLQL